MSHVVRMGEPFFLAIDDQIDDALCPAAHRLGLVLPGLRKPQTNEKCPEIVSSAVVDGELDKLDAERFRPWRKRREPLHGLFGFGAQSIHQIDQ